MIAEATAAELAETLRAIVRTGRATRHPGRDAGLPGSAVAMLALLDHDGEQRLGQLAERLAVDPSVVSRQVTALTGSGLTTRRPDPADGRAQLLALTPDGRAALERHRGDWVRWISGALRDWPEDDAQDLVAGLHRLLEDMQEAIHHASQHVSADTPRPDAAPAPVFTG